MECDVKTAPIDSESALPTIADTLRRIHAFQDELTTSPYSHDALEIALATAVSLPISLHDDSAQLWLMIAGVPSSDKTGTVSCLKDLNHAKHLDSLTENAFASGYVDPKGGNRSPDLLPELDGKALIIKDLTTLFSMRDDKVKKVLGDLQSIYDGAFHKHTGTRGAIDYQNIHFTILACITNAALSKHQRYLSAIGSRFLIYQMLPLTEEERRDGFALLQKRKLSGEGGTRRERIQDLRTLVKTLGDQLVQAPLTSCDIPRCHAQTIERLASLLARGRATISYCKPDEWNATREVDNVQIEEPWRAFQQLQNILVALIRLHGRTTATPHEVELCRRVALFTIPHARSEILRVFSKYQAGLTVTQCAADIEKGEGRTRQLLNELVIVQLVRKVMGPNKEYHYYPLEEVADLICKPIQPLDHILETEA